MSNSIAMPGQKLYVDVVRAMGLHHMNHFTGDHPYVQCEVKHFNRHERTTRKATKPVTAGDTMNPVWGERLEIEPWQPGEDLEFTIYDKGLIGSKTEGKVTLPSSSFYPNGFNGMLPIEGLPSALLQLAVQPAGGATSTYSMGASTAGVTYAAAAPTGAASTYSMPAASTGVTYSSPSPVTYSAGAPATSAYSAAPVTYSAAAPASYPVAAPATATVGYSATAAAAPTTYSSATPMMAPSTSYGTSQTAMPMQTYTPGATTATYSAPAPTYVSSSPMVGTTPGVPMQQTYAAPTVMAPQTTYAAAPSSQSYTMQQPQSYTMEPQTTYMQGGQAYGMGGTDAYKLAISIVQAQGLRHLNHFTGDHPYVVCEVKHHAHRERKTKVQTKPVTTGDTLNPVWYETLELEPWHQGEPLEFSVYDKGLIGSKTEGKALLTPENFFPNGFNGMLPISGLPHALLNVSVRVLGPSAITAEDNSGLFAPAPTTTETVVTPGGQVVQTVVSKKNRSKKLKGKKKSGCC